MKLVLFINHEQEAIAFTEEELSVIKGAVSDLIDLTNNGIRFDPDPETRAEAEYYVKVLEETLLKLRTKEER